jgi:uncharacterized protein (TIGR03382 family)
MRAVPVALALTFLPGAVTAENNGTPQPVVPHDTAEEVIGGTDAPLGKWPDTAAVLFNGQQACTGTLIAPTVALTAGHCNDSSLNSILVGTNSLTRVQDGEILNVTKRIPLPQNDTLVLVLDKASRFAPRALGTGWAKFDIVNGGMVQVVGYGTINASGSQGTNIMKEATTTITDFDCSFKPGCGNFEIGAGGMGIDTCPGDSGGPLYLLTSYGNFVIGVTSRAYSNATQPCGQGGIYGRPDLLVDQIEAAAGVPITKGPEPALEEPLIAIRGSAGESRVVSNDPKGTSHTFAIVTQPAKGQAAMATDGTIRVCVNPDAIPGDTESVVVSVTDAANPMRSVTKRLTISVAANEPVTGACDPTAFGSDGDGGGCCDSGGSGAGGSALLSLFALVALRRRRR